MLRNAHELPVAERMELALQVLYIVSHACVIAFFHISCEPYGGSAYFGLRQRARPFYTPRLVPNHHHSVTLYRLTAQIGF